MTPAALEWVARFRRYLSAERRLSPHTDAAYARDLAALVRFCDRQRLADWSALDSQHVRGFAAREHARRASSRAASNAACLRCAAPSSCCARAQARRSGGAGGLARVLANPPRACAHRRRRDGCHRLSMPTRWRGCCRCLQVAG